MPRLQIPQLRCPETPPTTPASRLFVILADEEYDAGLSSAHEGPRPLGVARPLTGATALPQSLHDAQEAKNAETCEAFARYRRKIHRASLPSTLLHYAYTIVYPWSNDYGATGAHALGAVALAPSAVPSLTCAKLPSKGRAVMKSPGAESKDGVLVAEDRESKEKGKNHLGTARRWVVRDWDEVEEGKKGSKAPAAGSARRRPVHGPGSSRTSFPGYLYAQISIGNWIRPTLDGELKKEPPSRTSSILQHPRGHYNHLSAKGKWLVLLGAVRRAGPKLSKYLNEQNESKKKEFSRLPCAIQLPECFLDM
ncbi:hypothetical protein C8R47DRAFT_1201028 [Mycena vitilis]|nr:hypothetical protein C8R47DRAFT_1201028 [Mycena vitilis]